MAEYIEREAFRDVLAKSHKSHAENSRDYVLLARDVRLLNEQPTADVVEVVRCKDCKYWQDNNGGYPHKECRWGKDETPDADDFCSFGER